jgi:hypothetical protein
MLVSRSTEGRCAGGLVCLAIGRSDGITILGDLLATYLPYFMCSMPIAVKTLTGFIVVHVLLLVRLVAQKSSPAVHRAEGGGRSTGAFGIYESRSYRDEARRVRDDLDKVVGGERGRGLVTHLAYGEQLTWGPKITGPGSSDVGAPFGETRVRGSPRAPQGSPRLTSAHLCDTRPR